MLPKSQGLQSILHQDFSILGASVPTARDQSCLLRDREAQGVGLGGGVFQITFYPFSCLLLLLPLSLNFVHSRSVPYNPREFRFPIKLGARNRSPPAQGARQD
jgi:hypothetical protein